MTDELVSTAGVLLFDPASEFQILEELDYDEMVQRPEEIRFFTLEQQTTSYAQALLPKSGKVPKSVIRQVEHEVDTMRQLYERVLMSTDEGYELRTTALRNTLPWADYYVKTAPSYALYSFENEWKPLFEDENRAISYTTILDALPRLSPFDGAQEPLNIKKATNIFSLPDDRSYPMLGQVPYTKTAYIEDGTFRIQNLGRAETQDKASFDGYRINPPPLEFPNPLDDNAFLNRRTDPVYIDTNEPLENLLPSVDLIMQHAVPDTTNPNRDARPFLKVWDIRMNEIPWNIWKSKFLPEDTIANSAIPASVVPTTSNESAPAEELIQLYESSWYSGLSARYWLAKQIDGGKFVSVALLSKASAQEPIPVPPMMPEEDDSLFTSGTAEDCISTTVSNFETFASAGIFRPGKKQFESQEKPGWEGKAKCLPLTYIQQEQSDLPLKGRLPWLPDTDQKILNDYTSALKARIIPKEKKSFLSIPKAPVAQSHSDTRLQILALMGDIDNRLPEDIAIDVKTILNQLGPEPRLDKHIYSEATTGEFLVCEHSLHQLEGDYAKDPAGYLKAWAVRDAGSLVCKFCGETISNEIFVAQDTFDAKGFANINYAVLEKPSFQPVDAHSTKTFNVGLKELKELFDTTQPAEDIMYLLISLLQILPDRDQLKPYLDNIKSDGAKLAGALKGADKNKRALIQTGAAVLGFSATALLIQTHNPPLIPRRSIGGKPFVTSGFPRDSSDINESPLIDGMLNFLRKTFEEYPVTFGGSSVLFVRLLLTNQKSLRQKILNNIQKSASSIFKVALDQARDNMKPMEATASATVNSFNPPLFRFAKSQDLKPEDKLSEKEMGWFICKDPIPPWFSGIQVVPQFRETQIVDAIEPSPLAEMIRIPSTGTPVPIAINVDQVRQRIKIGIPKDFASATYRKMVESDQATMLQKYTEIILNTLGLMNTPNLEKYRKEATTIAGDPSLLRDFFKGLLYELATKLDKATVVNMERELSRNIVLRGMNTSADTAKAVRDKLRALETTDYKQKMRVMSDVGREITKKLQDLGLAPYLVNRADRESFMRELTATYEDQEEPDMNVLAQGEGIGGEIPEEGTNRGSDEQEAERYDDQGNQHENDEGDYGDVAARNQDGEDMQEQANFNYEEGYGS